MSRVSILISTDGHHDDQNSTCIVKLQSHEKKVDECQNVNCENTNQGRVIK
jgi:hypothetical protein